MGKDFIGVIVEESFDDNRIINGLEIKKIKITGHSNPSDRWHMYEVAISKDEIDELAKLDRVLYNTRLEIIMARLGLGQINYEGTDIAVYCTTIGGPATAGLMEEMISKGCEKFVFFGSCGVLNREIAAKSLIIPTAAYRDEGTSYHYISPSEYIEVASAPRLAEILTELKLPYVCGKTWTTDAIYRETRANMESRKNAGCLTVEMECASIMAVAQFRGVDVYQFLYAADSLDAEKWDARTLGSLPQESREKYLRIALEVAVRV